MQPIAAVVVASSTRNSAALIGYVLNDKKDQRGERYVVATGVNGALVDRAEAQFRDVRKRHGKDRAGQYVQAYHVIQAFAKDGVGALDPENPDDWLKAHELGRALAKLKAPGREAIVVTQRDGKTGCLHNHIVINSVERETGRSYNSAWVTHSRLVQEHDELLADMGYVQRDDLRQAASDSKERFERGEAAVVRGTGERGNRDLRDYAKWLEWDAQRSVAADLGEEFTATEPFSQDVLVGRVREAVEDPASVDWDSFVEAGASRGVRISKRGKKNTIRYGMVRSQGATTVEPTSHQTRRDETLGAEFTLESLEQKWAQQVTVKQHQVTVPQPAIAPTTPVPDKSEKTTPGATALGMGGTDDLGEKGTSFAAATDIPAPADAPLSQDAKYADSFADLWAEREANKEREIAALKAKLGIGKTLAEIDTEKAAEAATAAPEAVGVAEPAASVPEPVESQETAFSAAAANTATPTDAPLSQATDGQFQSLLRQVRVREQKRQQLVDAMAVFEEQAVTLLETGGVFAEADVPHGVGRKFLDVYGDKIDPEVLFILEQRETKKEAATALWESAAATKGPLADLRREKARKLRNEVRAGDYEMDDQKQSSVPSGLEPQATDHGPSLG